MSAPIKAKKIEANLPTVAEDFNKTSTPAGDATPRIPVVRTLRPPPEIWELVHPVPPVQPRPASAFVARLASSKYMFVLLVAVVVSTGVYIGLRSGKGIPSVRNTQVVPARQVETTKTRVGDSKKPTLEENAAVPDVVSTDDQLIDVGGAENVRRSTSRRVSRPFGVVTQVNKGSAFTKTTNASKTASSLKPSQVSQPNQETRSLAKSTEKPGDDSGDSVSANRKSRTTLSRQLIDSPKTETPRKAKVIPWP